MEESKREAVRSAGVSLMVFGGLLLFFSLAIIVADPENGRSAFPYPSGLPSILTLAAGIVVYLAAGRAHAVKNA